MSRDRSKAEDPRGRRVSLHPLSLKEAVKGLLETKPDKSEAEHRRKPQKPPEDHQGGEDPGET